VRYALLLLIRSGPHGVLDTSARNDIQFLDQKQGADAFSDSFATLLIKNVIY
jgi:hypothetical protein